MNDYYLGHLAEWLRSGLQSRGRQFESGSGLHLENYLFIFNICNNSLNLFGIIIACVYIEDKR